MKKMSISMIFNCVLFFLVLLATIIMFTGFEFMGTGVPFTDTKLSVFKFFTVDSNLLLGISALLLWIQEKKKKKNGGKIAEGYYILKFAATTSVFLTMMVTACFLAPFTNYRFIDFYMNSNLFFHFLIPLLSIISFVFYDSCGISFRNTFYGVLPMVVYGIVYIANIIPHVSHNQVSLDYDFYGFFRGGISTVYFVVPIMLIVTYALGCSLWFIHNKIQKKDN